MPYYSLKKRHVLLLSVISLLLAIIVPAICLADAGKIFRENNKAVVVIVTYDSQGNAIAQGSGFIVKANGAVATNYHVISNAKDIKIKVGNKVLRVEGLLYIDKENDLVILKVDGKGFPTVKIGDVVKVNIGEKVYVIGSPQGLENTISDGILSGIREITPQMKVLQITAPISAGSSGGPVFNQHGEVIGIATFIIKDAQNLNFAMPVKLIKDNIARGKVITFEDIEIEDYKKTEAYWFYIGVAYADSGRYKEAIEVYKQAIRIKPNMARAYTNLGAAYGFLGLYKDAIEASKQAIRIEPDDANAHYNLGVDYGFLGMHKEAIEAYKQAIRIEPDMAEAHNNLGNAYDDTSMYKEAIEAYKQAIRIEPDYAKAHYNLGNAYGRSEMYKEAIEAYKQAVRIKSDMAEPYCNLGIVYGRSEMYKEAIESFKQAIRIKPDIAEAHYYLGVAYLKLNDRGLALEQYKILKDLDTGPANKLFNLIYK